MHALDYGVGNGRLTSVQRGISMQVSVENTSALERRMTIGVPAERIEAEVNKRLQQTAQKAKIPGFRPGKVPMSVIRQRYEADARQEALGNVVQSSFYEAVVEQKLNPAGAPSIEPKKYKKGNDYMQRNAYLVEDVIKWVNSVKQGTQQNVVLGQSMGGVIARYALRDMENQLASTGNQTWNHKTNLYISHDAPHQGANMPLSIQYFARHLIDQFVSTPLGDMNINMSNSGGNVSISDWHQQ